MCPIDFTANQISYRETRRVNLKSTSDVTDTRFVPVIRKFSYLLMIGAEIYSVKLAFDTQLTQAVADFSIFLMYVGL